MADMKERSTRGSATTGSAAPHRTLALAAMLFAVSMTFIDQTIVAIAAPSIVDELDLSSSGMQWVVNAYLLTLAAFFALGGRLADVVGHRRVMVAGTVIFVVSSALCGCVPDDDFALAWLIAFRATQGLGAALMFPAALAVVVAVFPVDRRGRALALFFGLSGALTALGPLLGRLAHRLDLAGDLLGQCARRGRRPTSGCSTAWPSRSASASCARCGTPAHGSPRRRPPAAARAPLRSAARARRRLRWSPAGPAPWAGSPRPGPRRRSAPAGPAPSRC